jgi:hypothetical protein
MSNNECHNNRHDTVPFPFVTIVHVECHEEFGGYAEQSRQCAIYLSCKSIVSCRSLRYRLKPVFILFVNECDTPYSSNAVYSEDDACRSRSRYSKKFRHEPLK